MSDGASLGTARGTITIDSTQALGSLNSLGGALDNFNSRTQGLTGTTNSFAQSTVGLAQGMQNVGNAMERAGSQVSEPFVDAAKSAADFQSEMANTNAVMDVTGEQFSSLSDLALQLGQDTSFTANEAAQGITELGRAGISFEDIMSGAAAAATDLAGAGGVEVPKAAAVMSAAMAAFNISGSESVKIADALAGAANFTLSDVNQLGLGLAQVGGIADSANMSMEDTVAFLGLMADNGLRGSDAATSMKSAILRLLSPTDAAATTMDNLGISLLDTQGNFIGLQGASQQFFDAWKRSGQTMSQFLEPLGDVFGSDAIRAILFGMQAIEADQTGIGKGWSDYEAATHDAGAAHDFMVTKMDTTEGAIERLSGSLDTLRVKMGTPLIEAIRGPIEAMVGFVNALANIPGPILGAVTIVGALAGAILTAGGAFLVVGGYVLEAVARFQAVGISMDGILAIIGRLTLGLTGLGLVIAAVALAINTNFLGARDAIQSVLDLIDAAIKKFQLFFNIGKAEAGDQGPQGKGFFSDLAKNISAFGRAVDAVLGTNVSGFFDMLAGGADRLNEISVGLSHAADLMKIYGTESLNSSGAGQKLFAVGRTLDKIFGTDLTPTFDKAATAIDKANEAFISLTSDSGWKTFPALVESAAIGLEAFFGSNAITQGMENFAQVAQDVQIAWESSIQNGINPISAALRAASVAAAEVGFDALSDALDNAATNATKLGDNFAAAQDAIAAKGIVGLPNAILALNDAMIATIGIGLPDFLIGAANAMAAFQTAMSNGLDQGLNPFQAALKGLGAAIGSVFGTDARNQFFAFVDAMGQLGTAVQGAITSGLDRVGQMFSEIGTALSQGDIAGALTAVQSLISDVGTELQSAGQKAIDWAINVGAPTLIGWAKEQAGNFGSWLKEQLGIVGDMAGQTLATIQGWFFEVGQPTLQLWSQNIFSWIQEQLNTLFPKAGETLKKLEGWVLEVGAPTIQSAAGEAGTIKDQIIKWISDQIVFPNISELPDIHAKVQAFATELGSNLASFLADAMAQVRSIIFGGGGGGGAAGPVGLGGSPVGGMTSVESDAKQLAGTLIDGFLRGFASGFAEAIGQANIATFISTGDFEPLKQQIITMITNELADLPGQLQSLVDNTKAELGAIFATLMDVSSWLSESEAHGPVGLGGAPGQGTSRGAELIQKPMEAAFNGLVEAVKTAAAGLKDKITAALPDNPFDGMTTSLQGFADGAASKIDAASTTITTALNNLQTKVNDALSFMGGGGGGTGGTETIGLGEEAGKNLAENAFTPINSGATQETTTQTNMLTDAVGLAAQSALEATPFGQAIKLAIEAVGPAQDVSGAEIAQSAFSPFQDGLAPAVTGEVQNIGQTVNDATASAAPSAMEGIGSTLDTAMATAVDGITLEALAQAIGRKIGDAVVAGLAAASGGEAQAGLSAGTGGAANIGSQIAQALVTSIQGADFTAVGSAISTQIGTALSAGFGQAEATGPSTAGIDIGSQIAIALASAITGSDFSVVSQAIQQKIGESLSGGTGGTTQTADTTAVAGEGATIGASIAASLANAILSSDFSTVGQAINQKISEAVASASSGATTGGAGAGLGGVVGQGGGIASGIVSSIVASFASADFSGVASAISSKLGAAITAGIEGVRGNVASAIGAVIETAMTAAESANEAGIAFSGALAGGISATSGDIDIAASTAMTTAVTSATTIASSAAPVGTVFDTAVGGGIGAGTGTVTGAVDAMVQAGISAGTGSAAGASAVGDAFDTAAGGGIGAGAGTLTGAVTAMVGAAIDAGVGAAAGASAIGAAISSGAASGVIQSALEGPVADMVNRGIAAGLAAADAGSPSRKMMQQGEWLAEGAAIGIDKAAPKVDRSMARMINNVIKHVKDLRPVMDEMNSLGASFEGLPILDQIGSSITSIADNIHGTIGSVRDSMKDIIKSMADTLKSGRDKVSQSSTDLASSAADGFNQLTKDRKSFLRDSMKKTKGSLFDLQDLGKDIGDLRDMSQQLEHVEGPNDFAKQVNDMADSLQSEQGSAIQSAVDLFNRLDDEMEKAKKRHHKKGKEAGDEIGAGLDEGFTGSTGTAVNSVDSLTDQITNTLNANLSRLPEMAQKIGEAIPTSLSDGMNSTLPALTDTVNTVGDTVTTGVDAAAPAMENSATTAGTDFGTALRDAIDGLLAPVTSSSQAVGEGVGTSFEDGVSQTNPSTTVDSFGSAVLSAIQSLQGSIRSGGESIGTAFTSGVQSAAPTSAGKGLTDQVESGITSGIPSAENTANDAGTSIGENLTAGVASTCNDINDQATSLTNDCVPAGLNSGLGEATQSAKDAGQTISDALQNGMEIKKNAVSNAFSGAGKGFGSSLAGGISTKVTENRNAVNSITDSIGAIDATSKGKSVGTTFGSGIVSGINSQTQNVKDAATALVNAAKNAADDAADNGSPSRLFMETGFNMMDGIRVGIESGTKGAVDAMKDSTKEVVSIFAGQGMSSVNAGLKKDMNDYTAVISGTLQKINRERDRFGFIDPTDDSAKNRKNDKITTPMQPTGPSITIGSIEVQKGSPLEQAIMDMTQHLQATNGQYVKQ
jgi:TP901 family phage tail tape measure protein